MNPPTDEKEYIFSYNLPTGKMSFRLGEDRWLVDRIAGQWEFLGTKQSGHMMVSCELELKNDNGFTTAYVYKEGAPVVDLSGDVCNFEPAHDHSQCMIGTNAPFPQGRETHWRLCYAREIAENRPEEPFWRLRDERTGELWFVHDYRGIVNVNYFDQGSHIFVDMPCNVEEGIAVFG